MKVGATMPTLQEELFQMCMTAKKADDAIRD
jgi:hypothetical protein